MTLGDWLDGGRWRVMFALVVILAAIVGAAALIEYQRGGGP